MTHRVSLGLLTLALSAVSAQAALQTVTLSGVTQYDAWLDGSLTASSNPGYGGFPGTGTWPSPIGSSATGSGDATLNKTANGTGGGPYPASASMYFGGFSSTVNNNGGQLTVTDTTPVSGVTHIVFQVDIAEAWTYDFWNGALPVLSYNGGSQALTATTSELVDEVFVGTVEMPSGTESIYRNTYLLEWDVTGLSITSFSISFNGVQHAQLYALQLDQSNGSFISVIPEPSALGLMGLAVPMLTRRRR